MDHHLMSPSTAPAQVFISYSHKDNQFFKELLTHMRPYERAGIFTAWNDKKITPGSLWFDEIRAALTSAKVAVLLVSPAFLESNFIQEHEFEPLLNEARRGGVCILWVLIRACSYMETPVKYYQAAYSLNKPLAKMKEERDDAWVVVCQNIKEAVVRSAGIPQIASAPSSSASVASNSHSSKPVFLQSSPLVGLPGQTQMDQAIIAAGGNPISPLGTSLYGKK